VAHQKLGQHFLTQGGILERIASAACPQSEPLVIEIGPGRGALTRHLLARAARVVALELDRDLVEHLRREFADEPRLDLLHTDVLRADLGGWGPAVVAGNLPYYITSPILDKVAAAHATVRRGVFLVQKEVADRIAAGPGQRDYGYLTVALQLFFDAARLFTVKPGAFRPPPEVDSAVVRLEPNGRAAALGIEDPAAFRRFAALCFRQKRKMLRNNLAGVYPRDQVNALPEASARAEQLSLEQIAALYHRLVG